MIALAVLYQPLRLGNLKQACVTRGFGSCLVFLGLPQKVPLTGRLKQLKCILSQVWRPVGEIEVLTRLVPAEALQGEEFHASFLALVTAGDP